jgi:hypothetical protein
VKYSVFIRLYTGGQRAPTMIESRIVRSVLFAFSPVSQVGLLTGNATAMPIQNGVPSISGTAPFCAIPQLGFPISERT